MSNIFAVTQRAYRFYEDGTEDGSVAIAAEDTNISRAAHAPNLLLRVGLQESGAGSVSGATTDDYQLQVSKNGAAYANVTAASSNVKGFASASLADAGTTTNRLSAGSGSFVAGEISEVGLVTDRQLTANNHTEMLYALSLVPGDLAIGNTLDFRVLLNGATITYSVTPRITITASQIAGTSTPAFGQAPVLTGRGALLGTAGQVFSESVTLVGRGALAGSAAQVFTTAGDLTGAAAGSPIAGVVPMVFGQAAALRGRGALAGVAPEVFTTAGLLTGRGALAGIAAEIFGQSAELRGRGALAGVAAEAFGQSVTLRGKGALAGAAAFAFTGSGLPLLPGAIAGVASLAFAGSPILGGRGRLFGTSTPAFGQAASLTGKGSLAGAAPAVLGQSVTLRGLGVLAGALPITFSHSAALTDGGGGSLAGNAGFSFTVTVTIPIFSASPLRFVASVPATRIGAVGVSVNEGRIGAESPTPLSRRIGGGR